VLLSGIESTSCDGGIGIEMGEHTEVRCRTIREVLIEQRVRGCADRRVVNVSRGDEEPILQLGKSANKRSGESIRASSKKEIIYILHSVAMTLNRGAMDA
jgi:hypothetical protein